MTKQMLDAHDCAAVLARQEQRQCAAQAIMERLSPLDRWKALGEPYLCGAMSYGLLVKPDIDIEVFGELRIEAGFALMGEWARDSAVRRIQFLNAIGETDAGLGWELGYQYGEQRWNVQMWLLPEDYPGPRSVDLVEPMLAALTPRTRCAILRIKEALLRSGIRYQSIDLYRAVIEDGVADAHEYERWCWTNSSVGLVDWRPDSPTAASQPHDHI
ncbi:hypothetical protein [Actinomadura sp. 6N118]|uniref:hypothetical protein n=1 Tax=Actinomadura sp. 6N118 TaxID=3375151 RepID=UPI00379BC894